MYKTPKTLNDGSQPSCIIALYTAILIQAVSDYQELNKMNTASQKNKKSGYFSKSEIARFLKSDWCRYLLDVIGCDLTGEYILSCLQTHKTKN